MFGFVLVFAVVRVFQRFLLLNGRMYVIAFFGIDFATVSGVHGATALRHATSRSLIRIQKAKYLILKRFKAFPAGDIIHGYAAVSTAEVSL